VLYKDLFDNPKDLEEACRRGNEIAKKVTEYLRAKTSHDIIKLENEKLVCPLVLFRKKKYIGKFYMVSDGRLTKGKGMLRKCFFNFHYWWSVFETGALW
jgi:DNA polymerase elongation subunit (family B)